MLSPEIDHDEPAGPVGESIDDRTDSQRVEKLAWGHRFDGSRVASGPMKNPESPNDLARWESSGVMALSGRADGPALGPPAGLIRQLDDWAHRMPGLDPLPLLAERAELAGLSRSGTISCGGATRLLATSDAHLALSLPRIDDIELLPAWLEIEPGLLGSCWPDAAPWDELAAIIATRPAAGLDDRAALLGLPVGTPRGVQRAPVVSTCLGAASSRSPRDVTVADMSSLWAGPLCGALLAEMGAKVTKIESTTRPDGARRGPPDFFRRLNGTKESVTLDFSDPADIEQVRDLILRADVVIESSRPRALRQLGISAHAIVTEGPQIWVSITGHGRDHPDRVAFGDDAAVAGGLVCRDAEGPVFCADAIADPASGLAAASACIDALAEGGRWLLDVSMVAVAAAMACPA